MRNLLYSNSNKRSQDNLHSSNFSLIFKRFYISNGKHESYMKIKINANYNDINRISFEEEFFFFHNGKAERNSIPNLIKIYKEYKKLFLLNFFF